MKKIVAVVFLLSVFLTGMSVFGQEKREFADYQEMRAYLGELFNQKKYAEAAALLESVLDRFPDNVLANTYNLATARIMLGDIDKAVAALEEGHRRGLFYGLWVFEADPWKQARGNARFEAALKENAARIEAAEKKAEQIIDVVTPEGYDPSKKYPLFIALHGGGESIAALKPEWNSPRLRNEFITAFIQSTQVSSMRGFHWQKEDVTRREIVAAYEKLLKQYPIDTGRVLIGGFSSGGFASLILAFSDLLPVRGFVVLCFELPQTIGDNAVLAAVKRGVRGTFLTTEQDGRINQQKELAAHWAQLGFDGEVHITPNIGHWFPKNFAELLDQAIGRILGEKK
jgi:predicted esterase